jgi:hypothetical protein
MDVFKNALSKGRKASSEGRYDFAYVYLYAFYNDLVNNPPKMFEEFSCLVREE